MNLLKKTLLPVLFTILGLIFIFALELFLNIEQTKFLISIIFIISIVLIVYGLIQIVIGKSKSKFFRGRINGLLLICFVLMFFIFILNITAFNVAIYEAFDGDFTALEKIQIYKTLNTSSREKENYDLGIDSYIEELNIDRIDHVSFYYDDNIDRRHLNTIKKTVQLAENLVADIFGEIEKDPLKIILYSDEETFKIDGFESDLIQGYFDGENIHIKRFMKEQPVWEIEQNIIHEYSHYAFKVYLLGNEILKPIPAWFNEGIAEYISNYKNNIQYSLPYTEGVVDFRDMDTTEKFSEKFELAQNGDKFYNPYLYSHYMIDSLVDLKGEQIITDIILRSKDMGFYESFKEIVGIDIETYQNENLIKYIGKKSSN